MVIVQLYVIFSLCTIPYNEGWNAKNPRPYPECKYLLINWERDDFRYFPISQHFVLKDYRKSDSKRKAKARRLFYERKTQRIR